MKKLLWGIKDKMGNDAGAFEGRPFVFCTVISLLFLSLCFMSSSFYLRVLLLLLSFVAIIYFKITSREYVKFGKYTNWIYVLACIMCFVFGLESIYFCDYKPNLCEKYLLDDAYITAYAVPDTSGRVKITEINGEDVSFYCTVNGAYIPNEYEIFTCRGDISRAGSNSFFGNTYYIGNNILLTVNTEYTELTGQRADTVLSYFYEISDRLRSVIYEYCENNPGFISGVFLGNKSDIPASVRSDFSHIGISHIIAVSGMHVIAALAILSFIFKKFIPSKALRSLLLIPVSIFYALLTGCIYSAMRAVLMFVILNSATALLKRSDSLTSLFIALYLICTFQPYALFDISLQLSAAATVGIIIFGAPLSKKAHQTIYVKNRSISKLLLYTADSLIISVSAIIPIIPLTAYYFGKTSLLSPLMTLTVTPFILLILYFTPFIFLFSKIEALALLAGQICDSSAELAIDIVNFASRTFNFEISLEYVFSHYVIIATIICVLFLLIIGIKNKRIFASACGVSVAVYFVCMGVYHISALDNEELIYVCKVDDVICCVNGNHAVAVDITDGSSASYNRLFIELRKRGIMTLDTLIVTRCGENHARLIDSIAYNQRIEQLIIPDGDMFTNHVSVRAKTLGIPCSYYDYKAGLTFDEYGIEISPAYYLGLPRGCTVKIDDMMYTSGRTYDVPTDKQYSVFMYGTFSDITERSLVPVNNTNIALIPYKVKSELFFKNEYNEYKNTVNVKLFNNTAVIDLKELNE